MRGGGKTLASNTTNADTDNFGYGYIDSFDTDGFSTTTGEYNNYAFNKSSATYVAWNWLAATTFDPSTAGTIVTASGRSNSAAGFSMVTYTGVSTSPTTIGHGLAKTPEMIITKRRDYAGNWFVGSDEETAWTYFLELDGSPGQSLNAEVYTTSPTASVYSIGDANAVNYDTGTFVSYIFHGVEGYSKVGKYTGNVNADGTFAYLGFRPAMILIKGIGYSSDWHIFDNKRIGYNVKNYDLTPSENVVEITDARIDFLSNGFKIRTTAANINSGGNDLLYYAIAESPFKYANAR